ncbi:D-alanyl-D-alanine carboxypeptidase [Microbacterium resistens]|uniref:D-alanyl-D-alanine carboxypeptidase family protein n=1 Tax=Microbacterium resistens TaxID=156977 RepID=UPI001C5738D2|nr:D-alanyl-D-alanine carboxypeptidase [Microbacterium resistens]MBW1638859.1 D-alanyl-D-alanine carboxypeptidase [Microbacterium resistens]
MTNDDHGSTPNAPAEAPEEASAVAVTPKGAGATDPTPDHAPAPVALAAPASESAAPPADAFADGPEPETDALSWVDIERLASSPATGSSATAGARGDLLSGAPQRPARRAAVLAPLGILVALGAAYAGTTALWPLTAIAPTVSSAAFEPAPADPAALTWPVFGSAALAVDGIGTAASDEEQVPMASITKLVTVLAALDALPLAPGEQGPSFAFTAEDSAEYWRYRESDQSSLDVPVDGSLTEYQLLQGILLGSANNYADRLAREIWGSDADFVAAGEQWLRVHDISGISLQNPSGFGFGNESTPRALIDLGRQALSHPVVAEIVATPAAEIPGAGLVQNSNKLLTDAGVVGVKTGTIGDGDDTLYNVLTAKDIPVGDTTVRAYASVLGQPDDDSRYDVSRTLYSELEAALSAQAPTVTRGTVLGTVETRWGATAPLVAAEDGRVVLWNGALASATSRLALGDDWDAGGEAGSLALKGPLNTVEVPVELGEDLAGPGFLWRLTHPVELFGLAPAD